MPDVGPVITTRLFSIQDITWFLSVVCSCLLLNVRSVLWSGNPGGLGNLLTPTKGPPTPRQLGWTVSGVTAILGR
jgi:hypothetical protein